MDSATIWIVYSMSFIVALSGAMSPGPLFTYTIIKSIQAKRLGFLMGFWIIIGHALLEFGIILILLFGFSTILANSIVIKIIGVLGCCLLCYFGLTMLRDLSQNKISASFLRPNQIKMKTNPNNSNQNENATTDLQTNSAATVVDQKLSLENKEGGKIIKNPILGGIVVSMSNPYWWFWWAAVGFAFMTRYGITFQDWGGVSAFFFGHESGDLLWYLIVSIVASLGRQALNKKVYYIILAGCALFMIGFGIYLGISPFITF